MFSGKVAVITGASGGFGSAIAFQFAKASANLVLTGRNKTRILEVAKKCEQFGSSKALPIVADLANKNDVSLIVEKTVKQFGKIDILINNAGVFFQHSLMQVEWEEIDKIFDINCKAPLMLSKLCMPYLIKTKGCIVNMSSQMGPSAKPPYVSRMSRGAVDQLTLTLASEFVRDGVRINCVKPAVARSNLTEAEFSNEHFIKSSKIQPLGGLIKHKNVADAVYFLCSPNASAISGEFIKVDGGKSVFPLLVENKNKL